MGNLTTRAVADHLGVPYYTLANLLRAGRMAPPTKNLSGDYVWSEADVERARAALAARRGRREPVSA
jgi:predicted site-specific integrase-resolvase